MPLYEYKCDRCGQVFEIIQRFSDEPLTTHEACGGAVERLLSAPALQFKGSGWYITDYAKSGNNSGPAKNGGAAPAAGETKGASSDSSTPAASSTTTTTDTKK